MQVLGISQMLGAFNPLKMNLPTTTDKIYYVNFTLWLCIHKNNKRFLAIHPVLFCNLAILK